VVAAICFGTLGPLSRFAADAGFTAVSFAVWRSISAAVALTAILVVGYRLRRIPATPLRSIARFEWLQLLAMGLFVAGTTLGLFFAFERTSIAIALMVFYTFPIIVAAAAVPIYGEHLDARKIGAIGLASVGLLLLLATPADGETASIDPAGVFFALCASLCQVGFALVGARGFRSVPSLQSAALARGFSLGSYVVLMFPVLLFLGQAPSLTEPLGSAEAWLIILFAGVISAGLPAVLQISGYRRIGPSRGAVLMLVEPLTGVVLAALLLAERPAPLQLVGGLLLLSGAALAQLRPTSKQPLQRPLTTE
jgi:drug/metabolite transporter (DMT)-like permease